MNLKNYPKTRNELKKFAVRMLKTWAREVSGEDSNEISEEDIDPAIEAIIDANTRILYDFFDEKGIYTQITLKNNIEPNEGWKSNISNGGEYIEGEKIHISRKDAELAGFQQCMEILEKKL